MSATQVASARTGAASGMPWGDALAPDALALLAAEHDDLRRAFDALDPADARAHPARDALVRLCLGLKIHAMLERELVYPVARAALARDVLIDRAEADDEEVQQMIESLLALELPDVREHERLRALHRVVDRQFGEAEVALFSRLAVSEIDLEALGRRLEARRRELLAELGLAEEALPA